MMRFVTVCRKTVKTASSVLDASASAVVIVSAIAFALLIFVAVLSRYVFHFSLIFSVEISKLLFVWSAFLAATAGFKRKSHIRFEFLNRLLGARGLVVTDILLYASSLVFFQVLLGYSIRFTRIIWRTYLPVLGLSQGWLYVSVIVSSIIFMVHALDLLIDSLVSVPAVFKRVSS